MQEPFHQLLGPVRRLGGPAGIILKNDYIISRWGDNKRIDMIFSVTKSYLAATTILAINSALIAPRVPVKDYIWGGTFVVEHNAKITWKNLLQQNSEWSGKL